MAIACYTVYIRYEEVATMTIYTAEVRFSYTDPFTGMTLTTCVCGAFSDGELAEDWALDRSARVAQARVEWHDPVCPSSVELADDDIIIRGIPMVG